MGKIGINCNAAGIRFELICNLVLALLVDMHHTASHCLHQAGPYNSGDRQSAAVLSLLKKKSFRFDMDQLLICNELGRGWFPGSFY